MRDRWVTSAKEELTQYILPFWMDRMTDHRRGGFYGRIDGENRLHADAPKGAILHARILWTFAAAYRVLGDVAYLRTAEWAKRYLLDHFVDRTYGGVYWKLDANGYPTDTKKQIYAIGFTIYGLSEFHRATGDREALDAAIDLYRTIEQHSYDAVKGGYMEAYTREWEEIADMRLSEKDENRKKTMNTHLHVLEPYTNLYRVWKDPGLKKQITGLVTVFFEHILNRETGHLGLFFDEDWKVSNGKVSFGHDIEASWLLYEALLVVDDKTLADPYEKRIERIVHAADEGLNADGSLVYEQDGPHLDRELHWWVQAENVVGHLNLYQHFGNRKALDIAAACWNFIRTRLTDREGGEWIWSLMPDGTPNRKDDKAGFWKCPYHNGRMCLEIIERFSAQ